MNGGHGGHNGPVSKGGLGMEEWKKSDAVGYARTQSATWARTASLCAPNG